MTVQIITPSGQDTIEDVTFLDVPAHAGRMTVLEGHQPFVCTLAGGPVAIRTRDGAEQAWSAGPGTMTVEHGTVTLLVRLASRGDSGRVR